MGGSDNKGNGLASQPRRYRVPGQPLLNRHQVGGVSCSPDGLFAQQEWDPTRGRPAVRGKRTYGGRPGQHMEEQGTWASRTQKHSEAGYGRPVDRGGVWTAKTVKRPRQQPAHPQYGNYWAPLTHKWHTMPHSAQPQHTNYWAPRTRKRHQQEHGPQRPTGSSDPTQHAKGRTGDCPGPRKGATTRRNVTQGGGGVQEIWAKGACPKGASSPLPSSLQAGAAPNSAFGWASHGEPRNCIVGPISNRKHCLLNPEPLESGGVPSRPRESAGWCFRVYVLVHILRRESSRRGLGNGGGGGCPPVGLGEGGGFKSCEGWGGPVMMAP